MPQGSEMNAQADVSVRIRERGQVIETRDGRTGLEQSDFM
jgi:hypothetical protein